MSIQCTHLLASGQKCQAPAMKGSSLCRHHHPHKRIREDRRLDLPPLSDPCAVLYAATEIVQALAERRIKRSDAATLLFGLRLTANLMSGIDKASEKAYASGIDSPWESIEADSPCDLAPDPGDTARLDEMTIEEAKAFLVTLQTTSVEKALKQLEAKHPPRARTPHPEHRHPSPRAVAQPAARSNGIPPLKSGVKTSLPCTK